jgi:general secretion pathway protein K
MKIFLRSSRSGFAVIIVLVAVAVLSILAGALAMFMKVENQLAQNGNDDEKLLWVGRAGVERACWILANEPSGPTSLKQIWAGGAGEDAETNSPIMGISLDDFPVGDSSVSLKLIEQESKINVNGADSQLLHQILTTMGADAGVISIVSDSIQDWIDSDDATRPAGAESDYYQGLTPPYYAKNAPIDDLEELQLIKGITPHMFNGGPAPDANAPFQHHKLGFGNAPGQEPDYAFGLRDVLTPYSNGKINVNTADANVLTCIPGVDATAAQNIIGFRSSEGDVNAAPGSSPGVIQNLNQLTTLIPDPLGQQQIGRYCTVSGSTYEVHATAQVGTSQREFVAVAFRLGNTVQIFSFHPK